MTVKEQLHALIDELPDNELGIAKQMLEQLRAADNDPVLRRLLLASEDDEAETKEECEAVQEAREDLASGAVISHDDLKRELGL